MAGKRKSKRTGKSRPQRGRQQPRGQRGTGSPRKKDFIHPIVGIGGSAGGFEAALDVLRHLSPKTGMAFVIVQHLDPHHVSRLPNLLRRATTMPVIQLTKTSAPQRNTVYVQRRAQAGSPGRTIQCGHRPFF